MRKSIKESMHEIFLTIIVISASVMFCACSKSETKVGSETNKEDLYVKSGEITGVGRNIDADIEVKFNVKDNKIIDVSFKDDIDEEQKVEIQKIYKHAKEQMISKNSINVDAVSGATSTIRTINSAAKEALIDACFDLSKFGAFENQDKEHIKNGVYEGNSSGMNGKIKVQVEVADKKIKDVKVLSQNETPGIGSPLKDIDGNVLLYGGESPITKIPELIVKNQSVYVDAVSGATITSDGIMMAVSDALLKAGATENDFTTIIKEKSEVKDIDIDVLVVGA